MRRVYVRGDASGSDECEDVRMTLVMRACRHCRADVANYASSSQGDHPLPRSCLCGESAEEQTDRRELDERLAGLHRAFVVLGQPPMTNQPGAAPFNDPPSRLDAAPPAPRCSTRSSGSSRSSDL